MSSKETTNETKADNVRNVEQVKIDVTKPIPTLCMSTAYVKHDDTKVITPFHHNHNHSEMRNATSM